MDLFNIIIFAQPVYDGKNIALSGITTVFMGLILIALSIAVFNLFFISHGARKLKKNVDLTGIPEIKAAVEKGIIVRSEVDDDVVAAIGATVELYKRLHLESLQSKITFKHGREQSGWKAGVKYGHRV